MHRQHFIYQWIVEKKQTNTKDCLGKEDMQ